MENKEFRNALVNAMKAEIAQLANEQIEQKKTRKLANRPKVSLGDIVEKIKYRAYKITNLLYYYRWVKHGLKYWANRDVHSFKEYYALYGLNTWFAKNWDNEIENIIYYTKYEYYHEGITYGEVIIKGTENFYKEKCQEYNIEYSDENLNYIMTNI